MPYTTQSDIESILSVEGVTLATDDDRNLSDADTATVDACISRASAKFEQYALQQYEAADLTNNVWVKWCVATLSAVELMRRRGQVIPASLQAEADQYLDFLKEVAAGEMVIPNAAVRAEQGVAMSNLVHDMRYPTAKVRVIPQISTGRQQSEVPRRTDISSSYIFER